MANQEIETIKTMMFSGRDPNAPTPSVAEMRQRYEGLGGAFPVGADVTIRTTALNGVPAEEITAEGADTRQALLYFHGGGYALGGFVTHRTLVSDLSRASRRRAYLIDYRLAPENSFPAPVEDAVAAYRALLDLGYSSQQIVLGGDSAGGGLTLATMLALKQQGLPLPAGGLCISPWADLEMTGSSHQSKADEDPMVRKPDLLNWTQIYLKGADPKNPLASPIHGDFSGLPPLLIQVGTAETLLDDARMVADRAKKAGVTVQLQEWQDMIHVWHHFAAVVGDARKAIDEAGRFFQSLTA
ncbi:MAG: alpha/beta hydrolase [Pseudomonadales bacterium]|jgi:acetyl esterase/lipase|nr:alpha/beta hydrolase [Pseudomonadales bacterium]MCC6529396.1 alpha/beta hydrolase [Pseudomonadales bacterium]MCP5333911.1 alpha/beta hydrolase [Pseudomonadales bacterium]HMU89584.1 alpha/beta hydrolase [Pseudomonadales bacterium]HMW15156.1 alpha/beta hydrolase [Pseudomonadales bacterium]